MSVNSMFGDRGKPAAPVLATERTDQLIPLVVFAALTAVLVWGYWNTLSQLERFWNNPKYSHGYLVPVFTLVLLWLRYQPIGVVKMSERWAGLGLLCVGLAIRLLATYFPNLTPDMYSFVVCLVGLVLMIGGWRALRWAGPPIAFLIFMFPLPGPLDGGLLTPLQKLATKAGTFCLQTLGIATYSEGNSIFINEINLNVVEACSGLRMLTIFVALAVAITMVTDRPIWERIVIVISAVPIALAVNIVRITITGILHLTLGSEIADKLFHPLAGWVMMPMALGMLYAEFQILSHLFIDDGPAGPLPVGMNVRRSGPGSPPV